MKVLRPFWVRVKALVLRWFRKQPKPPMQPERLLYGTGNRKPEVGDETQDYYDRFRVTRVEEAEPGYWRAYGKRIGPSTGPGTKLSTQNARLDRQEEGNGN